MSVRSGGLYSWLRRRGGSFDGNHGELPGSRVCRNINLDAVKLTNQRRLEHRLRCASCEDVPLMQQNELAAEAGRKIQVVRRHDDRQRTRVVEPLKNRADLELVREIE